MFAESELILNPNGSIYHLNLRPEQLADTVITVGDPDRVGDVSHYFDSIELKTQKREFVTHTGSYRGKRITVLSTGIGTDNIDIVLNELDALANINFKTRELHPKHKALSIIRIGTTGGLQTELPVDSFVVSRFAVGIDGLFGFYDYQASNEEQQLLKDFNEHMQNRIRAVAPYAVTGDRELVKRFSQIAVAGITVTCPGFYGPQGRVLRGKVFAKDLIERLEKFSNAQGVITNFEMETAGIYALGSLLGHHCVSLSAVVADRVRGTFSTDPHEAVNQLIAQSLELLIS